MRLSKDYMLNDRIRTGARYIWAITLFVSVALVINLSIGIVDPMPRMQSRPFWWTVITTAGLLVAYAYLMTYVYYKLCPAVSVLDQNRKSGDGSLYSYVLVTTFLITMLHVLCLVTVAEIAEKPMEYKRYFRNDYPFFLFPVVLYAMLLYRYPYWRMYPVTAKRMTDDHQSGQVVALQERVALSLGYPSAILLTEIRYFDILLVFSTSEEHIMYLINGEAILVSFNTKEPEKWPLAPWFVKISGKVVVNMLHIAIPVENMTQLKVHAYLETKLLERIRKDTLDQLLTVSRRMCEKNLRKFLNDTAALPENGWDDRVPL